jgi:Short C-terminal domain
MKARVKPGKGVSFIAAVLGLGMIVVGGLWVIPRFGSFGIVWVIGAVAITGYHLFNVFSRDGVAIQEIDVDVGGAGVGGGDTSARLQELNHLRAGNLITEEEYQRKRAEIIRRL